jgi:hypothetical protein
MSESSESHNEKRIRRFLFCIAADFSLNSLSPGIPVFNQDFSHSDSMADSNAEHAANIKCIRSFLQNAFHWIKMPCAGSAWESERSLKDSFSN